MFTLQMTDIKLSLQFIFENLGIVLSKGMSVYAMIPVLLPALPLARTLKRTFKTSQNLLTGRHGNIIRSAPNTLLASGPEIPRKVRLSALAMAKAVAELESQPNLSFPPV